MGKRIIFCADGTWDEPGKDTNVYKIYKALTTSADQVPYYDDGVGSDGLAIQKLAGGAFGTGLFQKIKDGYTSWRTPMKREMKFISSASAGALIRPAAWREWLPSAVFPQRTSPTQLSIPPFRHIAIRSTEPIFWRSLTKPATCSMRS